MALAVSVTVCFITCAVIVAGTVHALGLRNRVIPGRRSPAPLGWLVSLHPAARLHRRLRAAAAAARMAVAGPDGNELGLVDVVGELHERAGELDVQLVIASRAPHSSRRRMLRELQSETSELERLVERVIRMSRAWAGSVPSERGLAAVRARLELLESALRELDGVELRSPTQSRPF